MEPNHHLPSSNHLHLPLDTIVIEVCGMVEIVVGMDCNGDRNGIQVESGGGCDGFLHRHKGKVRTK